MSRVMIIDDQVELQQVITATLEAAGYSSVSVFDPRRALEVAASTQPDAVILDVVMPGLSGWDLLADLRKNEPTARKPILMLSSLGDSKARARGIRLGADDFLLKPFDPEELLARLAALLRRRGGPDSSLQGRLQDHPLSEVIQGLQNSNLRGRLEVLDSAGGGWLEIEGNRLLRAQYGACRDAEALLAMLPIRSGEFGFYASRSPVGTAAPTGGDGWALPRLLLEAAWIDDELALRRDSLPPRGTRLELLRVPEGNPENLPDLRLGELTDHLATAGAASLDYLLAVSNGAPARTRLAVAWLIQDGCVQALAERSPTSDLGAADQEAGESALRELFQVAVLTGLSVTPLRIRFLVDSGTWPRLSRILASISTVIPGSVASREISRLLSEGEGDLDLSTEAGELSLSVIRAESDSWQDGESGFEGGISMVWCKAETLGQEGDRWRKLIQGMSEAANKILICDPEAAVGLFDGWPARSTPETFHEVLGHLLDAWS